MGEVLLATDTRLERKVAIKRILGEGARCLKRGSGLWILGRHEISRSFIDPPLETVHG
jgi:hypothetical protein